MMVVVAGRQAGRNRDRELSLWGYAIGYTDVWDEVVEFAFEHWMVLRGTRNGL